MDNLTVKILCQYWENYSDSDKPYWKPKGAVVFKAVIDYGVWHYDGQKAKEILSGIVAGKSNVMVKYDVVEFELEFSEPTDISGEFAKIYNGEEVQNAG